MPFPMPLLAPVTNATLFSNRTSIHLKLKAAGKRRANDDI
jgi:hypothetical protein